MSMDDFYSEVWSKLNQAADSVQGPRTMALVMVKALEAATVQICNTIKEAKA